MLAVFSFVLIFCALTFKDFQEYGLHIKQVLWLIDRILNNYIIFWAAILIQFAVCCSFVIHTAAVSMYRSLDQFLARLAYHKSGRRSPSFICSVFRREHTRITRFVLFANQNFYSRFLFTFVLYSAPYNVYIISMTIIYEVSPVVKVLLGTILIMQAFNALVVFYPLVQTNSRIHVCGKYFVPVQTKLTSLLSKLKHQHYFETVLSDHKLGFTVGNIGVVSKTYIFEVLPKPLQTSLIKLLYRIFHCIWRISYLAVPHWWRSEARAMRRPDADSIILT